MAEPLVVAEQRSPRHNRSHDSDRVCWHCSSTRENSSWPEHNYYSLRTTFALFSFLIMLTLNSLDCLFVLVWMWMRRQANILPVYLAHFFVWVFLFLRKIRPMLTKNKKISDHVKSTILLVSYFFNDITFEYKLQVECFVFLFFNIPSKIIK